MEWPEAGSLLARLHPRHRRGHAGATSDAYKQSILGVRPVVGARVKQIEIFVKDRWCSTVVEKHGYYEHLPHKICSAFGEYWPGYTLADAKKGVRECFEEYDNVQDANQLCVRPLALVFRRLLV